MALRLGELPFGVQLLICLLVFALVVAVGEFYWPLPDVNAEVKALEAEVSNLRGVVNQLQVAQQEHARLQTALKGFESQLANMRNVVPEEKQTDEFIRTLQSSARVGQVAIRRIASRAVVYKDFYAEMPFNVEMDGPYYNVMNFFNQLGGGNRIINASNVTLTGLEGAAASARKYDYAAGTTVTGTCTVTTFYIPSKAELEAAAPPKTGPGAPPRPATPAAPAGR